MGPAGLQFSFSDSDMPWGLLEASPSSGSRAARIEQHACRALRGLIAGWMFSGLTTVAKASSGSRHLVERLVNGGAVAGQEEVVEGAALRALCSQIQAPDHAEPPGVRKPSPRPTPVFRPIHKMPELEMEQPFVNHPLADHMDMVALVCYCFVILHSWVCALPLRVGWGPKHLARHPAPSLDLPRMSSEWVGALAVDLLGGEESRRVVRVRPRTSRN